MWNTIELYCIELASSPRHNYDCSDLEIFSTNDYRSMKPWVGLSRYTILHFVSL